MNLIASKSLSSSLKKRNNRVLYFLCLKNKFRRASQPGLTRYHCDYQDFEVEMPQYKTFSHCTNAEYLIDQIPPIEVEDYIALCYGVNDLGWGHPIEYITLNTKDVTVPSVCKYCGLRYVMRNIHKDIHHENI